MKIVLGQIIEKKSKFIANIFYVENENEAEETIKKAKKQYYDAKHNCYAYIVRKNDGQVIQKCSDDGEPSGTAGMPILNVLNGNNLCNILVVVTRYFGGILLGTGGLLRAYSNATNKALENANIIYMQVGKLVKITLNYSEVENFRYYATKNNIKIIKEEYSEDVEFLIEISNEMLNKITNDNDNFIIKMTKIDIIEEKYIKINITVTMDTRKI